MIPQVLIIEDEAILARNICIYLERDGMAVDIARSGEAGLEVLSGRTPSLVLLDDTLPGMHGLEVLHQILKRAPRTRVVMMAGRDGDEVAVQALSRGAADCIRKPVEPAELRRAVESLLQRRRRTDPAGAGRHDGRPDTLQRRRKDDHEAGQGGDGAQADLARGPAGPNEPDLEPLPQAERDRLKAALDRSGTTFNVLGCPAFRMGPSACG